MTEHRHNRSGGVGLERSCNDRSPDWLRSAWAAEGVELLEAWLRDQAYQRHRHDSYSISVTKQGVQTFDYRGRTEASLPGRAVVLHPDEAHDGRAGTDQGFGYWTVYVDPTLIFEAVRAICGRSRPLPFVDPPVIASPRLVEAVNRSFQEPSDPLSVDDLVSQLAHGLIEADRSARPVPRPVNLAEAALERAREFLNTEKTRLVRSEELEAVAGLSRYELARQFRLRYGTSPYRYLIMRRLDYARELMARRTPLVRAAVEAGFADQAHFTRMFKAAFGVTPGRYHALRADSGRRPSAGNKQSDRPTSGRFLV